MQHGTQRCSIRRSYIHDDIWIRTNTYSLHAVPGPLEFVFKGTEAFWGELRRMRKICLILMGKLFVLQFYCNIRPTVLLLSFLGSECSRPYWLHKKLCHNLDTQIMKCRKLPLRKCLHLSVYT